MAFENLFIRTKKSISNEETTVELDAFISESHSSSIRITTNPIELGADITDHAIVEPRQLTIVADVSDNPLGSAALGFGSSTESNLTRSQAAYEGIQKIKNRREPISVQTKLEKYDNMLITGISTVQDKDTSQILSIVITIEEIIITDSKTTQLDSSQLKSGSPTEQGTSAENKGRVATKTPDSTTSKSFFKAVTDWIGITQ
tara:strand:- start:9317 stop:9922 length:606 start_codon:yes stop_codon:yes gene_type:complete